MTCEVSDCNSAVFAACACAKCNGNGPLLCFDHFEGNSCNLVGVEAAAADQEQEVVQQSVENDTTQRKQQAAEMKAKFLEKFT